MDEFYNIFITNADTTISDFHPSPKSINILKHCRSHNFFLFFLLELNNLRKNTFHADRRRLKYADGRGNFYGYNPKK